MSLSDALLPLGCVAAVALLTLAACKTTHTPPAPTPDPAPPPATVSAAASAIASAPVTPSKPGGADALRAVAKGDRDFAARLYARLRVQPGNLFFSPTSIRVALGMALAGAEGETRAEMQRALALDDDAPAGFSALLADWAARARVEPSPAGSPARIDAERRRLVLRAVNRLWGQRGRAFQPAFLSLLAERYAAPLEELDFHASPDPSRLRINAWVEEQTEKRIQDLLGPGTVTPATRLVLTNAVYFKATWQDELSTPTPGDFYVTPGSPVKVPMMSLERHLTLVELDVGGTKAKAVVLPYASPGVAMIAIVPDARDGLAKVEAGLDAAMLDKILGAQTSAKVSLSMPKFRTTSSFGLGPTLAAMGMPSAFAEGRADFSGMDGTNELFLGAVIHKAFVAVDEKGTEAAAATAVAMVGAGVPRPEPTVPVTMDHPFFFVIADTTQKVILFAGRVADPR